MINFENVESKFENYMKGQNDISIDELNEEIDYMIMEQNEDQDKVKELREMKKQLRTNDTSFKSNFSSKKELFDFQKKTLKDCENIGLNVNEEIQRQNESIKKSEQKIFSINGKLLTSQSLTQTIQNNFKKNKLIFKITIGLVVLIFLVLIISKIF